jgi:hypothetical protein
MIDQAMWDTEQIGASGIKPDGRLDAALQLAGYSLKIRR